MWNHRSRGQSLVELLLVVGFVTLAMASIYGLYRLVTGNSHHQETVTWVQATSSNISQAFASESNYQHLTQQRAIEDHLFARNTTVEEGRAIGPWGGEAQVVPRAALIQGQSVDNAAFDLILNAIPSSFCATLASSLVPLKTPVAINGQSVGSGQDLDTARAAQLCDQPLSMVTVTFARTDASSGLPLCEAPTQPQQRTVACGSGLTGERKEQREGRCLGPYGEPTWSSWSLVEDDCSACPPPETQTAACSPGEFGQRLQKRTFDCPNNRWGEWQTLQENCQPCLPDETQVVACPAGQSGQVQQRRTFYCNSGTWGAWVNETSTCR